MLIHYCKVSGSSEKRITIENILTYLMFCLKVVITMFHYRDVSSFYQRNYYHFLILRVYIFKFGMTLLKTMLRPCTEINPLRKLRCNQLQMEIYYIFNGFSTGSILIHMQRDFVTGKVFISIGRLYCQLQF